MAYRVDYLRRSIFPSPPVSSDLEIRHGAKNRHQRETWKAECIRPSKKRLRVHTPKQLKKALSHLRHFGQVVPVIIAPDGEIVDGHLIYEALKELGHDEIEVVVVQNLSPAELQALRLFLNRLSLDSKWDSGQLKGRLRRASGDRVRPEPHRLRSGRDRHGPVD